MLRLKSNKRIILAPRGMLGDGALKIKSFKKIFLKIISKLKAYKKITWHASAKLKNQKLNFLVKVQKLLLLKIYPLKFLI